MSLLDHPVSQPSVDISPIWAPVITAEIKKLQLHQAEFEWKILFSLCWHHKEYCFSPMMISVEIISRLMRVELYN
jgi:hypothetical protein